MQKLYSLLFDKKPIKQKEYDISVYGIKPPYIIMSGLTSLQELKIIHSYKGYDTVKLVNGEDECSRNVSVNVNISDTKIFNGSSAYICGDYRDKFYSIFKAIYAKCPFNIVDGFTEEEYSLFKFIFDDSCDMHINKNPDKYTAKIYDINLIGQIFEKFDNEDNKQRLRELINHNDCNIQMIITKKHNEVLNYYNGILDIITFYKEPNDLLVIRQHLANYLTRKVHIICSEENMNQLVCEGDESHLSDYKYKISFAIDCTTFGDILRYCKDNGLINNCICLIMRGRWIDDNFENRDGWINVLKECNNSRILYAISQTEIQNGVKWKDHNMNKLLYANFQSCWIFKLPINPFKNIDFPIGMKGSDVLISHRFKSAGYCVINDSLNVRIYHNNIDGSLYNSDEIENEITDMRNGRYLVPDYTGLKLLSFDKLIDNLKMTDMEIYELKCEIFNRYLHIIK